MNKRETIRIGCRLSCRITVVQKWLPVQQSAWPSRSHDCQYSEALRRSRFLIQLKRDSWNHLVARASDLSGCAGGTRQAIGLRGK